MIGKILKILWVVIIFLFTSLQIYNLIRANYADVVISLLTVAILLAMIVVYGLIVKVVKSKKVDSEKEGEGKNEKLN